MGQAPTSNIPDAAVETNLFVWQHIQATRCRWLSTPTTATVATIDGVKVDPVTDGCADVEQLALDHSESCNPMS
jgi:hypothetical protein